MEIAKLFNALPSAVSQGVIWGIMAIGVYITYRILDVADLTVDGSIATGGAVAAVLIIGGCNVWVAMIAAFLVGMLAGLATGLFHTFMGIPAILAGILTQLSLYSINLRILGGKANMAVSVNNYPLIVSARNARAMSLSNPFIILAALAVAVIALLYWFFGTERGCSLRATGANANMARAQGINTNADKVLGLMLSNGLVVLLRRAAGAVSGLCRRWHGTRRDRHRSGCRDHRRSCVFAKSSIILRSSCWLWSSARFCITSSFRWCSGWASTPTI